MTEKTLREGAPARKAPAQKAPARAKPKPVPVVPAMDDAASFSAFTDQADGLLETCRTHWQYGEWEELAALDEARFSNHRDRAKLALLAAVGRINTGDFAAARRFLGLAKGWGCDARLINQVLISQVHNTLGRVAACLDDAEASSEHFGKAIQLVEPRAGTNLLGRTREIRETARIGLLPEAAKLMNIDFAKAASIAADNEARLRILKAEVELLQGGLSLALRRGQMYQEDATSGLEDRGRDIETHAMSQLGQDLWVVEQTGGLRGGYFVEFGATDGVMLSNSLLLEREFGWTGLCAEPNPKFFRQLVVNRRCKVLPACIGSVTGERVKFITADAYGSMMEFVGSDSHADKREAYLAQGEVIDVTTVSLHDFLTQNGAPHVVDYLSIDTEGSEYSILSAFPFDKWTIRFITVEHNYTPMRQKIYDLLTPLGYVRKEVKFDDWYALKGQD